MFTDFLTRAFTEFASGDAIVWNGRAISYAEIGERLSHWTAALDVTGIGSGSVVTLEGDFSPNSIAIFLALVERACIVVPQSNVSRKGRARKDEIAEIEHYIEIDEADAVAFRTTGRKAEGPLYAVLRERRHPGLVLFSSGTSGEPKAAVHDFVPLLEKFHTRRNALRTLNFLLFDHWGGLNTLLHTLSNGGTVVTVRDRSPDAVCALIEAHKVHLLPATPTFLNLLLVSGACRRHDLGTLKVISYGAEPMPQATLDRLRAVFPNVQLMQTYGLIEVGVLRSKSRENGSLWVKVGGEGYQTRIVDGMLQIKTSSTILGYINAPSPITPDGWFMTGDAVEQDGDYLRILGRKSEIINVGGEKVYPTEVESVIQEMDNVVEATVYGKKNPLLGNIVCTTVRLMNPEDPQAFTTRLKLHCASRLERFKIPVQVAVVDQEQFGDRFKKARADISQ
jgi:acyl-CoA synthetase (AMP-forming)/AMP-acid ligase II